MFPTGTGYVLGYLSIVETIGPNHDRLPKKLSRQFSEKVTIILSTVVNSNEIRKTQNEHLNIVCQN